jgi:protein SPA2
MDSGYGGSSTVFGPSKDWNRRPPEDDYNPGHKQDDNSYGGDGYQPGGYGTRLSSPKTTTGVVVPNKSTIADEDIKIPYRREVRESSSTAADYRELMRVDGEDGEQESTEISVC